MSTYGFAGFVLDGIEKIEFTSEAAYPSGLGVCVLDWVGEHQEELLRREPDGVVALIRALEVVADGAPLTDVQRGRLRRLVRPGEHRPADDEAYEWLLARGEGVPQMMLDDGVIADGSDYALNSQNCEWGYLIDVDTTMFEVYRGFQRRPHSAGRFAARGTQQNGYFSAALTASWPLAGLPNETTLLSMPDAY